MTKPLRLGIAGTGRMAARMLQALCHAPMIHAQSVASNDAARAKWFADEFGIANASGSVAEMAASDIVDAIYVAGRTRDHASAAMAAIEAGKPVLVEKPLAIDLDETKRLLHVAKDRNCLLVENLWCLALPSYRALQERLKSGDYGATVHLRFEFGYPVQPDSYPSLFDPCDGGAIRDRAVYGIALAIQLLGPVDHVDCSAQQTEAGVDLNADLRLHHASGALSHISVALNALMSNTASISCTHGNLALAAPVLGSEILTCTHMPPQAVMPTTSSGTTGLIQRIKSWPTARKFKRRRDMASGEFLSYGPDFYLPILSHFHELVSSGQTESDLAPLSLSLETQEVMQRARNQLVGE